MGSDDLVADVKTYAVPPVVFIRGNISFEGIFSHFFGHAGSGIGDADRLPARFAGQGNGYGSVTGMPLRIGDQIGNNLDEPLRVCGDFREVGLYLKDQLVIFGTWMAAEIFFHRMQKHLQIRWNEGKGKPSLLDGNGIHQIQHDPVDPHYRLLDGAEIFLHKRKIQRFFQEQLGSIPGVEGDGIQRIFDLMGNGGQEGGLGVVEGAQPQVLFLKKDLLLIVFLQMKIQNNAADNTYGNKCQEHVRQPVSFCGKMSDTVRKTVCKQAKSHIQDNLQKRNDQSTPFFQHQNRKDNGKYEKCRHAAIIAATGKKHHRKDDQKDHNNRDQITALIFPTVIGIKKKSTGYDGQRKIDQHISPGAGSKAEKSHDQTDYSAAQGENVKQPDAKIQGRAK